MATNPVHNLEPAHPAAKKIAEHHAKTPQPAAPVHSSGKPIKGHGWHMGKSGNYHGWVKN